MIHSFDKQNKDNPKKQWNIFLRGALVPNPGYLTVKMSGNSTLDAKLKRKIKNGIPEPAMLCFSNYISLCDSNYTDRYGNFGFSVELDKILPYGAAHVLYYISSRKPSQGIPVGEWEFINDIIDLLKELLESGQKDYLHKVNHFLASILNLAQPEFDDNGYPYYCEAEWRICDSYLERRNKDCVKAIVDKCENKRCYYVEKNKKYILIKLEDIKQIFVPNQEILEYANNSLKGIEAFPKNLSSKLNVWNSPIYCS